MKTTKIFLIILSILFVNFLSSQNDNTKIANAVNETDKLFATSSKSINSTGKTLKSTINDTKKTIDDIKNILNLNKNKPDKLILITINNIDYSNVKLKQLHKSLEKIKGVKNVSKNYQNSIVTIEVNYKKEADKLWGELPVTISNSFKVISVDNQNILIALK